MTKIYEQFLIGGATTDSRQCAAGSVFFALRGASFDGNRYAASALAQGCGLAVVDDASVVPAGDERYVLVPSVLQAYKDLAREHRRAMGTPIIGITGTNGKTTTKELIAAVLARRYRVLATEANYNNDVGVPKTLLRLTREHEIAVVEMGASHPGDIKTLVDTVEPDSGIITNVGLAHLAGFGSFEGVVRTKGELYDKLRERHATVFVDTSNEHLMPMTHGLDVVPYVQGEVVDCKPFLRFRWQHEGEAYEVQTHLIGAYNMKNMLAAATIGLHYGVPAADINAALAGYVPQNNRSQLTETATNHLIVDAYNANPTSMSAAIENFALMAVEPKMAILGDMGELGSASAAEHQRVVDMLRAHGLEDIWLVGKEFGRTDCAYRKFTDVAAVKAAIAADKPQGAYILIKGSNSTHLYELPAEL